MVRAYYMDDSTEDQRLPHELSPPEVLDLDQLFRRTGVLYHKIDESNWATGETRGDLKKLITERGYTYNDICEVSPEKLGDEYEGRIKMFYKEHLHSDEEIRLVEEGSGYFDVRDCSDRWIRVLVVKGDLLIVPAGIYHRFTLDTNNYIKVMRLFVGEPVWTPINRPAEEHEARLEYLKSLESYKQGIKA